MRVRTGLRSINNITIPVMPESSPIQEIKGISMIVQIARKERSVVVKPKGYPLYQNGSFEHRAE